MILATLENMRKHAASDVVAYSPYLGDVVSANPNDYFDMPPDGCIEDAAGEPMILAQRIPEHFKRLEES